MRRTTTLCLGLALALGIAMAATAGAQDRWEGRGLFRGHADMEHFHAARLERLAIFLDLTDQQIEDWRALHETRITAFEAHRGEMEALHERIEELTASESPDAAAIGELVIEAHRNRSAQKRERDAIHAEVLSILTPEQQERFEAMQSLHGDRAGDEGRRPGRHFGPRGHSRHHRGPELD